MSRGVVEASRSGVLTDHGVLVLQKQGLVSGVEINLPQGVEVDPGGLHEAHGAVDLLGEGLEARVSGVGREATVPGMDFTQIRVPSHGEGADEVEGGAGTQVGVEHASRIRDASGGREGVIVDGVAPVGGQGDAIARLGVGTAGLGVLPGYPPYLDHRCGSPIGEDRSHLQDGLKLETDVIGRVVGEGFRAVAPHEHEGAPPAGSGHLGAQGVDLAGEDEWRAASQVVAHRFQGIRVRVGRLLGGGAIAPAGRGAWGVELVHHTGIIWPSACAPAPSMKQNAGPDGDRRTADGAPSTLSAPKRLRRARRSGRDPP